MAKVSRLLLNEKKDKMTDEEFFMSKVMKTHFEGIIEGICKTFRRRIQILIINRGDSVACTDGTTIMVNLANDWIKDQDSRLSKYYIIVGIILHECGHILYTDLALLKDCLIALSDNRLIPSIKCSEGLKDCFENKRGKKFLGMYKSLDNCIEDGHIEKRVLQYVPGYGECLAKVRKLQRDELGDHSYKKLLEESEATGKKLNRTAVMLELILMYAKFGIDNTGDITDDLTEAFGKMRDHIDLAVDTNGAMARKKQINIIFDMLINFIFDEIENEHKTSSSSGAGSEDNSEDMDESSSEDRRSSSKENKGSGESSKDDDPGKASENEDDDSLDETEESNEKDSEPKDESKSSSQDDADSEGEKESDMDETGISGDKDEEACSDEADFEPDEEPGDPKDGDNYDISENGAEDEGSEDGEGTYDNSEKSDLGTESDKKGSSTETTDGGKDDASSCSDDDGEGDFEDSMISETSESDSGMETGEAMDFPGDDIPGMDEGLSPEEMGEAFDDILGDVSDLCDEMSDKTEHEGRGMRPVTNLDYGAVETSDEGSDFLPENEDGPKDWDLSYLENEAAFEEIAKDVRNKIEKAMKKNADDMRKERTDKYPSIERYVNPDNEAIDMFMSEHEELDRIARRVVKNLDKIIKERQKGDRLNGLYTGKHLDAAHAYRKDKKVFANKILPEDIPDMEVCVLVDCSGSMNHGNRMIQSRRCAYITWKFCQIMGIPCSVFGHTTNWNPENKVLMTCVAHPDSLDKEDEKRIFMLRPYADNRDGWAVNFCAHALYKSDAVLKMLLIISDGLPDAVGYGEILGKKDCQEVVKKYKKKGISVVTAGIDNCAADIKSLYIDGVSPKDAARFLDYSDMTKLPKAFANLIKKELL